MKASKSRNECGRVAEVPSQSKTRLKLTIRGAVQGVGFRPFVHRLATDLHLNGWVRNSTKGVHIEVEGERDLLESFLLRLEKERPPHSFIQSLEMSWLDSAGCAGFNIRPSDVNGDKTAFILPDIATCPDCLREVFDPSNRRYRYPFTNCTNCGPRFTIIDRLPYDRPNTTMNGFRMCRDCQAEYDDPDDRRFHAQPNACAACGPHLAIWNASGEMVVRDDEALLAAADAIAHGQIVAVKGIGGFHLIADARNEEAVQCLRKRKHREEKPFALMFPSVQSAKSACEISLLEERLLRSSEAPIVLLRRDNNCQVEVADSIAPANPYLGVMLPSSPLHHLLIAELGFPIVATSGNLSDEPICTDEHEAIKRLRGIADLFLVHNRPIARHVDDSIVRVMLNREMVLRRARGYAPLPIRLPRREESAPVLAVGAHLKNSVALSIGDYVFLSQHIGDLETEQAYQAFLQTIMAFENLYETQPNVIAADLHPDYLSTKFARALEAQSRGDIQGPAVLRNTAISSQSKSARLVGVQHHIAHVLSCMAENEVASPALGVAWDGTGYGLDETIWGGEFFLVTDRDTRRVAHLDSFRLPGADKAAREPRRAALGLLHKIYGDAIFERTDLPPIASFSKSERANLKTMLVRGLNSPLTTSAGRLFDAVASLVNLRQRASFEGQAAMELEFIPDQSGMDQSCPMNVSQVLAMVRKGLLSPAPSSKGGEGESPNWPPLLPLLLGGRGGQFLRNFTNSEMSLYAMPLRQTHDTLILDWRPMIEAIVADLEQGTNPVAISTHFHNALADGIVSVATKCGEERVVLSGGCFQNRYLTERCVMRLRNKGFRPYWHQRVPPNDGGIALGQVVAALRQKG